MAAEDRLSLFKKKQTNPTPKQQQQSPNTHTHKTTTTKTKTFQLYFPYNKFTGNPAQFCTHAFPIPIKTASLVHDRFY